MEQIGDLLTPWLTLGAILVPLVYMEKWIHSHLYGVGWLLTQNDRSATALYYVLLFPGVFVHEFVQYLIAGALNVRIKRVIAWPEAQEDGTLRLDFVQIQEAKWFQAAIIGAAPLFAGLGLVWLISSQVLSLDEVVTAIQAQDMALFREALKNLASTPDFFLWIFLIFTISNAMLPTPADRQGWPLLLAVFAIVIGFLAIIGVGDTLYEQFTGPFAYAVNRVTLAFASVLAVEIPGIIFIGFVEEVLERLYDQKFIYNRGQATTASASTERAPGSNLPLPSGAPLPSIYLLDLPLPAPPKGRPSSRRSKKAQPTPLTAERSTPARSPGMAASQAQQPTPSQRHAQPDASPRPTPAALRSTPATGEARPADRRSAPMPGDRQSPRAAPAPERPAATRAQQPADDRRARPNLPDERRATGERAANQAGRPNRPDAPDRAARPDDRRARPLDQPARPGQPSTPDRTARPERLDDRRARPVDPSARPERSSTPDRTARPAQFDDRRARPADQSARPGQPGTPDRSPRPSPSAPDRSARPDDRRAQPTGVSPRRSLDDTQTTDRTQELRGPASRPLRSSRLNRPDRPPGQPARPRPFNTDDDDSDDDELRYEADPDVVQDIPDDDF